jgi:hypothetical protein
MKLLNITLVLLTLCGLSAFVPTFAGEDNQTSANIIVPELFKSNSVGATLTTDHPEIVIGSPVQFLFTVQNHSKKMVNYEFTSGQNYDVIISDSTGKAIWHWSKNRIFGQLITRLNLAPSESAVYHIKWTQRDDDNLPVVPGTYSVMAVLLPMARPEITGNFLSNPDNDPVNTGVPMIGPTESGAVSAKNTTPIVYAKTTIKIDPSQ